MTVSEVLKLTRDSAAMATLVAVLCIILHGLG
jgi:hypothetical protein